MTSDDVISRARQVNFCILNSCWLIMNVRNMDKLSHHVQSYPSVALDLLRGWAALIVLLVHVRGASFVEFGSLPPDQKTILVVVLFGLTRIGHEAVLIFFVLSGFLVGGK